MARGLRYSSRCKPHHTSVGRAGLTRLCQMARFCCGRNRARRPALSIVQCCSEVAAKDEALRPTTWMDSSGNRRAL